MEEVEALRTHLHCISGEQLPIALLHKEKGLGETHNAYQTLRIGLESHCLAVENL